MREPCQVARLCSAAAAAAAAAATAASVGGAPPCASAMEAAVLRSSIPLNKRDLTAPVAAMEFLSGRRKARRSGGGELGAAALVEKKSRKGKRAKPFPFPERPYLRSQARGRGGSITPTISVTSVWGQ